MFLRDAPEDIARDDGIVRSLIAQDIFGLRRRIVDDIGLLDSEMPEFWGNGSGLDGQASEIDHGLSMARIVARRGIGSILPIGHLPDCRLFCGVWRRIGSAGRAKSVGNKRGRRAIRIVRRHGQFGRCIVVELDGIRRRMCRNATRFRGIGNIARIVAKDKSNGDEDNAQN